MDIALFPGPSRRQWADTMINLEARKQQFDAARRARSDEKCIACLKNLRAENEFLLEQSRMLKTGYAWIYAEIKYVTGVWGAMEQ